MLIFIGDIHNDVNTMNANLAKLAQERVDRLAFWKNYIIQIGDYSLSPYKDAPVPLHEIWFMDGNHDYMPDLVGLTKLTPVAKNLTYIPRGTVLVLEGRKVGFLGGGNSLDKDSRVPGWSWFPEEQITNAQAYTLLENAGKLGGLDLLVTHVPPATLVTHLFGITNISSCSQVVEEVWRALDCPLSISGHMHAAKVDPHGEGIVVGIQDIIGLEPVDATEKDTIKKAWKITTLLTGKDTILNHTSRSF